MQREYGIGPRDMRGFTRRELEVLVSDYQALQKAREG